MNSGQMKLSAQTRDKAEGRVRLFYMQTFGCQMNEYDSARVARMLSSRGYSQTGDISEADVIFLNTCSVREKAEQKVHSFLGRLRRQKLANPGLKIIVAGCLAQQLGGAFLDRFDYLDIVIGTRGLNDVISLIDEACESGRKLAWLPEQETAMTDLMSLSPDSVTDRVTASVTIMQGCDNFCSYCIVPHVRGRERSRPADEIIDEIRSMVASGVREVLLLGQNVNSYGKGLEGNLNFPTLLRRVQDETGVLRIRCTTSHPKDLDEELIRCFAELPSLCSHLHLPFQSGSDRILQRMNRKYTAEEYLARVFSLRSACPDIALTSDVMVGFPGETEEDFLSTMKVIETVQFDNLFSFRYSDRPFTASSGYKDKIDESTKARRLAELQSMQASVTLARNHNEIGRTREILVEGASRNSNGQLTGRTRQNRIVNFDAAATTVGKLAHVRITAAFSHSLKGNLLRNR